MIFRVAHVQFRAFRGLDVDLGQFRQLIVLLFLEFGEILVQFPDARLLPGRFLAEERGGLLGALGSRRQILVQIKTGQFARDLQRQVRRAAVVGHRKSDRRMRRLPAARIDDVGADHFHADVVAHPLDQGLARQPFARVRVEIIAIDQRQ